MKKAMMIWAAICLASVAFAQGDPAVASAQKTLKERGFYYGEVTGRKDPDTTAALRRYQIRNGLQITGELSAETRRSLGLAGAISTPAPRATPRPVEPAPTPFAREPQPDETSDLRDDSPAIEQREFADERAPSRSDRPSGDVRAQPGLWPDMSSNALDATPNAIAPPEVQGRVNIHAQSLLAAQGFYRGEIDGIYGPAMARALMLYQEHFGLEPTGRLDLETLASLDSMSDEEMREGHEQALWREPIMIDLFGEPIYSPDH